MKAGAQTVQQSLNVNKRLLSLATVISGLAHVLLGEYQLLTEDLESHRLDFTSPSVKPEHRSSVVCNASDI